MVGFYQTVKCGTEPRKPCTRPPRCTTPRQPTIYYGAKNFFKLDYFDCQKMIPNKDAESIQPWWLGGRASTLHSVESSHLCLGGSNPTWGRLIIYNCKTTLLRYIRITDHGW